MDWIKIIGLLTGMLIVGVSFLLGAYTQPMSDNWCVSTYRVSEYHDAPMGVPIIMIILAVIVISCVYWITKGDEIEEKPKTSVTCPKCGEIFEPKEKP